MKPRLLAFRVLLLVSAVLCQAAAQGPVVRLITMPRDGKNLFDRSRSVVRPLDDELLRDWRQRRDEARAAGAQVVILEVTAASGTAGVFTAIAEDFADLRAGGIKTVVFVPERATGPAALLGLEADALVLSSEAKIGEADPAQMQGTGADNIEAVRRDLRARVEAAARRGGQPLLFADAMLDPDIEIYEVRRTGSPSDFVSAKDVAGLPREGVSRELVKRKGETLSMNAIQATRFRFQVKTAESRDDLLRAIGLEDRGLRSDEVLSIRAKDTGPSQWFQLDWSLLLLALGILFMILELKTGGIGLNALIAIASLGGYFLLNSGSSGVDSAITIGLLLLGFLLLLVEVVFLPGFGVPGILGVALVLFSIYAATIRFPGDTVWGQLVPHNKEDYAHLQTWLIQFLGSTVVGTMGAILIAPRLHRFPIFNRAYLAPALAGPGQAAGIAKQGGVSAQGRVQLDVGAHGVSETDLRPAGLARIRDHRVDVVTDGEYVAKDTPVIVTAIEGHRVVVRADRP